MGSSLRARQTCPGAITSAGPECHAHVFTALLCASQPAPPAGSLVVPPTRMASQTVSPQNWFPQADSLISSLASFHILRTPWASFSNLQSEASQRDQPSLWTITGPSDWHHQTNPPCRHLQVGCQQGGQGEVRPRSGTQVMLPALPGREVRKAQAVGAPHFLLLPQALSQHKKTPRDGTWVWGGEKGVTQLLRSVSLAGDWIPSFRKFVSMPITHPSVA